MKTYAHFALSTLLFTAGASTWASCRMVSLEKNTTKYIHNLIKNSPDIYLADASEYSKENEAFTFKIVEVIHGEKKETVTVSGVPLDPTSKDSDFLNKNTSDFNSHKSPQFWDNIITGRTVFGSDCRLNPTFQLGRRYLLIMNEPYQTKSFELINSKRDQWYQHVVETIYPARRIKKVVAAAPASPAVTSAPVAESPSSAAAAPAPPPAPAETTPAPAAPTN
ncbi:MAG: hypothetical protein ACXVAX_06345 [Pseudobdellovibrio sp.]